MPRRSSSVDTATTDLSVIVRSPCADGRRTGSRLSCPLESPAAMQSSKAGSQVDILTIIAVLPFVAVCIVAAFLEAEQSRTIALNDAIARARTTMSAVDV